MAAMTNVGQKAVVDLGKTMAAFQGLETFGVRLVLA